MTFPIQVLCSQHLLLISTSPGSPGSPTLTLNSHLFCFFAPFGLLLALIFSCSPDYNNNIVFSFSPPPLKIINTILFYFSWPLPLPFSDYNFNIRPTVSPILMLLFPDSIHPPDFNINILPFSSFILLLKYILASHLCPSVLVLLHFNRAYFLLSPSVFLNFLHICKQDLFQ